jgi:hypothetical protein
MLGYCRLGWKMPLTSPMQTQKAAKKLQILLEYLYVHPSEYLLRLPPRH